MEDKFDITDEKIISLLKEIKGDWFEYREELISGGLISSFDLIKLISKIENTFEIHIPLERIEADKFNSVDEICRLLIDIKKDNL